MMKISLIHALSSTIEKNIFNGDIITKYILFDVYYSCRLNLDLSNKNCVKFIKFNKKRTNIFSYMEDCFHTLNENKMEELLRSKKHGESRVVSRIKRMEYNDQMKRLYFVLRDYSATIWFSCGDDDEANHLSARLGSHMGCDLEFYYNRLTGQLMHPPHHHWEHKDRSCSIS